MYHFFADENQVSESSISISGDDYNHIKNVIRLKEGDTVMVSLKNPPKNFMCEVDFYTDKEAILKITESDVASTELPCQVTLFQGLPKADKMELIIQKAVELGVYDIVPVSMKRCVVKLDEKKADSKIKRWNLISESAAKQSKRSIIPQIRDVVPYKRVIELVGEYDLVLVPYENEEGMKETRKLIESIETGSKVAVVIGPEGGFEDDEIDLARKNNMHTITLGKRILRTETAGLAALSMIAYAVEDR